MKKIGIILILMIAGFFSIGISAHQEQVGEIVEEKEFCTISIEDNFEEDTIILVLTNKVSLTPKEYTTNDFPEIQCSQIEDLTKYTWKSVLKHSKECFGECHHTFQTKREKFHRILSLRLLHKGKTNVIQGIKVLEKRNDVLSVGPNYCDGSLTAVPTDTNYSSQWGLQKIKMEKMWDFSQGKSSVLVGVIDSGIDRTHPDLIHRVETTLGYDFTDDTEDPFEDKTAHGTHVAGIIGAEGNNGIGVSGVCWNITLVSLKVTNKNLGINIENVISAINYAREHNIQILNMSMKLTHKDGLKDAIENYPGIIVCSAGNNGTDIDSLPVYPASYPVNNVIVVGSATSQNQASSFSNYGKKTVDVFAPGDKIYSTVPYRRYDYNSGTSMAAPFVTGLVALMKSYDSNFSNDYIKHTIIHSCDPLTSLSNLCVSGGRINAHNTLMNMHHHTLNYSWMDYDKHRSSCVCEYEVGQGHAVASNAFQSGNLYAKCLICGGLARMGFTQITFDKSQYKKSKNGSLLLPNGLAVLVEEDIESYKTNTLQFYDPQLEHM